MGLDMYLTKETYIGNKYRVPEEQIKIVVPKVQKKAIFPVKEIKSERISEIIEEVGYWRKANAIHKWFVDNVQKGNDNCGKYDVSKAEFEELLKRVNVVLKTHSMASVILPTYRGCFFGSYEYDKYYFDDLEDTKKILEEVLKEDGEFYYHSSW